jgi:uncharacterized protein (AIM24 family)
MAQRVLAMSPTGTGAPSPAFHELGGQDGVNEGAPAAPHTERAAAATTWRPMDPDRYVSPLSGDRAPTSNLSPDDRAMLKAMTSAQRAPDSVSITAITRLQEPPLLSSGAPRTTADLVGGARVVFPLGRPVSVHPSGAILVKSPEGFAIRVSRLRSVTMTSETTSAPLKRRTRGRVLDEALGGSADPIVEIAGRAELILHPEAGLTLRPILVHDEPLYLREDLLCGFDRSISYENGRLPGDDGDVIPMVQLRGAGTVIASLPEVALSVEVGQGRRAVVRARSVLGWTGRLVPRALLANEALGGSKGLVALAGEGMVLLDGR